MLLTVAALLAATTSFAQDGWHALQVPGGRATLRALGVDDSRERSAVMVELIRRLHFSTRRPEQLESAIRNIPDQALNTLALPQPLSTHAWERVVNRSLPPPTMFRAILQDPPARLIFHGLSGLDAETRQWFEGETDLLRAIYRDLEAAKAFAMFAPAVQVVRGHIVVPGGAIAEARWSKAIGVSSADPRRFVSRLFLDRAGRAAGLYFLTATVDQQRRDFVLHAVGVDGGDRFGRLVDAFASCYPRDANDYPFALRSHDPGILLLNASPTGDADAMVARLCSTPQQERDSVLGAMLAEQRLFFGMEGRRQTDVTAALEMRQRFPAVFIAMEHAGVREASIYAAVARHASRMERLNDMQATTVVLQQFQGALAMALRIAASGTITQDQLARLLTSLSALTLANGRYDGKLAAWVDRELLPAIGFQNGNVVEYVVASALAGPPRRSPIRVRWEDNDYIVDESRSTRDRLMAVRARQGGETLDRALDLSRSARSQAEVQAADLMLGQVLASWAYAPHVGAADSGALLGGDGSRRHDLGLRELNRTRFDQRWALATSPGDRGVVAGSYLGLEAALAGWSLRRLTADTIPPEPTLGVNDRMSLYAMVSLSDSKAVEDDEMHRISSAVSAGQGRLAAATNDSARLMDLAREAGISPWRRAALRWMTTEERGRVAEQFSLTALARLGGLSLSELPSWGTSAIPSGCLCLAPPVDGAPEFVAGRPADGMVGSRSADIRLRVAQLLTQLKMPAQLMPSVLAYAMRDYIDRLRPTHPADVDAFARAAMAITRNMVEDYLGAIAAVGPLHPAR